MSVQPAAVGVGRYGTVAELRPAPAPPSAGVGSRPGAGSVRRWPQACVREPAARSEAEARSSRAPGGRVARRAASMTACLINPVREEPRTAAGRDDRPVHRWPMWSGRDLPRPAPRQRPGPAFELSFAGRSAVFRRRRFGPALLREAPRCSCLAVACGDRGVSKSTWAAGLLFCADGVAVTVSVDRTARDASQATATTSSATTVSASMQDAFSVPSCPASFPNVSRGRRLPYADVHHARDRVHGASGSIRPRRPSIERHGASVPTRVHLPPASPPYSRIVRPRFGTWASPSTSYVWRARTGFPPAVWSPSLSGWLPTTPPQGGSNMGATIAPAPKRHQRLSCYHPCR